MTANDDAMLEPERLQAIRALLLDVDGVLTDGRLSFDGEGRELKTFHVHDGSGLVFWNRTGHLSGFISGRDSRVVRDRAQELGVHEVHLGRLEKLSVYQDILQRHGLTDAQVCYVGDDLLDLPILERCGLPFTVPSASPEVKASVAMVTKREGGQGAVREVVETILQAKGIWSRIVAARGLLPREREPGR